MKIFIIFLLTLLNGFSEGKINESKIITISYFVKLKNNVEVGSVAPDDKDFNFYYLWDNKVVGKNEDGSKIILSKLSKLKHTEITLYTNRMMKSDVLASDKNIAPLFTKHIKKLLILCNENKLKLNFEYNPLFKVKRVKVKTSIDNNENVKNLDPVITEMLKKIEEEKIDIDEKSKGFSTTE